MIEDKELLYDDDEAIKFVRKLLSEEASKKFSDDDIAYIIDLVYEYYEYMGYTADDNDDVDINIDEDEITAYIVKNALSDGVGKYEADDISLIVRGELEYCDSLGLFDE
jgi:hypothetical protein